MGAPISTAAAAITMNLNLMRFSLVIDGIGAAIFWFRPDLGAFTAQRIEPATGIGSILHFQ
jgi:hypothetical protein